MTEHEDFASLLGQFEREHAGPAKAAAKPREASPEPAAAPAGYRNAGNNGDPSCT